MKKGISIIITIIYITLLIPHLTYAVEETTTGMRMKPLVDKLSSLTPADAGIALNKYKDTNKHWAKDYIGKLSVLGIIIGGTNGKFNPDGNVSVAAFLKMTVKSIGYTVSEGAGAKWAEPYIKIAKNEKLIEATEFKDYNKSITREQAANIIYKASTLFESAVTNQDQFNVMRSRIKDFAQISDKNKDSFVRAYVKGFFELGKTEVCNPKGNLTRAQACTIVIRLLDTNMRDKFEIKDNEYFIGTDGKKYYPYWGLDPVNAINLVEKNLYKSKGFVDKASIGNTGADYIFYENQEEFETNYIQGMDFTLALRNSTSPLTMNAICVLTIFDTAALKAKHYEVIKLLFNYFFEAQTDEAILELEKTMNSVGRVDKEIKFNDRYLCLHGENGTYTVTITCKGGLNSAQFIEKYLNY